MSGKANPAASIRARLLNMAREQKADFQRILINYGLERLLYRISVSRYKSEFVLKGAMLFSCWSGDVYRATRDVDFLKSGEVSIDYLKQIFTEICNESTDPDDGLIFDVTSIKAVEIREEDHYGGIRITMNATLGNARIPVQADIGIGDAITPEADSIEFPTLLDMPAPILSAYNVETVIAEKFEAMVSLGLANSRMKDFYDVWAIQKFMKPDPATLARAIRATFDRRGTELPKELPLALTDAFSRDQSKQKQWAAFANRVAVSHSATGTLYETVDDIRPFLMDALFRE